MRRPGPASLLLTLIACLTLATLATAGNWPRFRGPNGDGVSTDRDVPVEWSEKNILWKVELPGFGNSSPIVWGDRLFLQTASKDGKEWQLLCLSTRDGKVIWNSPMGGTKATIHAKNSFASGTPATDGERVYTAFWDGSHLFLTAHDFQGNQVWLRDLGTYTSQHGAGHSPMLCQGLVFLADDQDGAARLVALDAKTGKDAWSADRKPFRACYSTPCLRGFPDGSSELIVGSTAGLTGYDPKTGTVNWNFVWTFDKAPLRTVSSPILSRGLVILTGGEGNSGARDAIAIRPEGKGELGKESLVWERKKTVPYVPTMLARGEYLYFVNDSGSAGCLELNTGNEMWVERLGREFTASPVLIGDKVFAPGNDGYVYVFAAEPKFHLLAKNSLGEPITPTPAVADNRLYIRGTEHLFCIGKPVSK